MPGKNAVLVVAYPDPAAPDGWKFEWYFEWKSAEAEASAARRDGSVRYEREIPPRTLVVAIPLVVRSTLLEDIRVAQAMETSHG